MPRGIDFGMKARRDFRRLRQQVPEPVERARGRLVPGDDQRQDLVQQLPVGHRLAGLPVARVDEQRHDIVAPHVIAAAALDVFHDALAQLPELIGEGQVARGMVGEERERVVAGSRTEPIEVVAEQRAQDDFERDFAHVLRHVDRGPAARGGRPFVREPFVRRMDMRHPRRDDRAMERGLHQPALRAPFVAFAGHQAVAEQDRDALDADALGEIGVMVDEHVADVVRMRQHPDVAVERRRKCAVGIAVLLEQAHQRGERVRLERDVERLRRARRCSVMGQVARASVCNWRIFPR